ncbi:hypothetical protein NKH48_23165 [Mesorhizobium sp. M1233]|uniref:hypothetical protein n=1 Tax=Mesorhizobium sp. M1233 TaxID=2957072 RepID=UPI00333DB1F4
MNRFERITEHSPGPPPHDEGGVGNFALAAMATIGAAVFAIFVLAAAVSTFQSAWPEVARQTPAGMAIMVIAALILALAAFLIRDILEWSHYPKLEIGLGAAVATQSANSDSVLLTLIGLLAAAQFMLDGMHRWKGERSKTVTQ